MMRYLDGESPPEEVAHFEEQLEHSTELRRELALFQAMSHDLSSLGLVDVTDQSVWDKVNRQLARPFGWILMSGGAAVWLVTGVILYLTSETQLWEKIATAAIVVGALVLLGGIGWESYKAWLIDPYKDVHR